METKYLVTVYYTRTNEVAGSYRILAKSAIEAIERIKELIWKQEFYRGQVRILADVAR